MGWAFLNETLTGLQIAGAALVLTGVTLVTVKPRPDYR